MQHKEFAAADYIEFCSVFHNVHSNYTLFQKIGNASSSSCKKKN